ncbi:MAG: signal peptidase I [Bdellovibrionaceae bacterium]|nr:signal peptidase I [Pseudobdellovibrionaceae bacterium]
MKKKIGLQGRWPKTLVVFFFPLMVFFLFRGFVYEPFVIPSESMMPNLLIHDHIIVNKYTYGLRSLFTDGWLIKFKSPERSDVVVFRYPKNHNVFFIKRLIGLPGDEISVQGMSLKVNGQLYPLDPTVDVGVFSESNGVKNYDVAYYSEGDVDLKPEEKIFKVPPKSYFVMGDNRYNSHDSRFWGFVPENLLIGKASRVWLSCEEMLESAPFICNPQTIRGNRFFKKIE